MKASVIICTYNRAASLKRTLESIRDMSVPDEIFWELIVVDNNSRDNTMETVEEFRKESGLNVVYALETKQGLSYARNRGIKEARGEIIVFTDDDVLVDKNWISSLVRVFDETDVAAVGGKILPLWEKEPPKWLTKELYGMLALLDYGDESQRMTEPKIWGANFAFRASLFEKHGYFNTSAGRVGKKLSGGEDTEFIDTLLQKGEKVYYFPDILVHHCIPEARMKKSYFRKWRYCHGGDRAMRMKAQGSSASRARIPLFAVRKLVKSFFKYLLFQVVRPRDAFRQQLGVISQIGFVTRWVKSADVKQF